MDALEAVGDDHAHAEQARAFGCPVARAAGAIFFASDHDQRRFFGGVAHGGFVDAQLFTAGLVHGHTAFDAGCHDVAQADVGEGAAHHHFMVHAARAVI